MGKVNDQNRINMMSDDGMKTAFALMQGVCHLLMPDDLRLQFGLLRDQRFSLALNGGERLSVANAAPRIRARQQQQRRADAPISKHQTAANRHREDADHVALRNQPAKPFFIWDHVLHSDSMRENHSHYN